MMSKELEKRLDELLSFALHSNANDLSDYVQNEQRETVKEIKQALTKIDNIQEIVNRLPCNGYFESVRDSIDRYNEIKGVMKNEI